MTFIYGEFDVLNKEKDRFVYKRSLDGAEYIVDCNLGKETKKAYRNKEFECIFTTGNVEDTLGAYEARIWKKK